MRVLLLDNYDSFTYNVADLLARLGAEVDVIRNDAETIEQLLAHGHDAIVISPGPGDPGESGTSVELIRAAARGRIPLLGICLGMQCIAAAYGARIERLDRVVHGAASSIDHDGAGVFAGVPAGFAAGRYHSLVVAEESLPPGLRPAAHADGGVLMAIRHRQLPIHGVQFHPESILTPHGDRLLAAFLTIAAHERGISYDDPTTLEVA
jgi:anthranilate synthase/aminodeoxychorismate synthase-like glutamine amidotransferase